MRFSKLLFVISAILVIVLWFSVFNAVKGYYPIPTGIKQSFYGLIYNNINNEYGYVNNGFRMNEKNYEVNYSLKKTLSVPYRVYLQFNKKTDVLPSDTRFKGVIKTVVTRDGVVVHEYVATNVKVATTIDDGGETKGLIGGFYLANLPFPIGKGTYKNVKIKITVVEIDKNLAMYIGDESKVSIFPDIAID